MGNVNPRFVLKTDDDAYVGCAAMVAALRELCLNPNCTDERCVALAAVVSDAMGIHHQQTGRRF